MENFTKNTGKTVLLILVILFADGLPGFVNRAPGLRGLRRHSQITGGLYKLAGMMHNGNLNAEDFNALAAGYYEGLEKDAGPAGMPVERDDVRFRNDFLRYELKPNVKRRYSAGMRITNSIGLANPEYGYEKPPHTRRIALLGDSIGLGPYGHDYETLLEGRLNQTGVTPDIQRFQIFNFSVYGYSVVQMMDVALDKAPQFRPDVYLVVLTNLEAMPKGGWRTHVARLVLSRTDLKYDYLRGVVAKAGVTPTDHLATIRFKLAPFFVPVTRWALEQIRDRAAAQGAQMIVVLMPAAIDPNNTASYFNRLRPAVDGLGVPVIDLRDAFRSVNMEDVQVDPKSDVHPNVRGHEVIFESLYAKLRAQPAVWAALTGNRADSNHATGARLAGKSF
jgi:hypothetical protein